MMNNEMTKHETTNQEVTNQEVTNQEVTNQEVTNQEVTNQEVTNQEVTNQEVTNQKLIQLFAEALETEASSIDPENAIAKYAEWDSLAWLTIISLLDEQYAIRLTGTEVRSFVTVNDVIENVTAKAFVV